MSNTTGSCLCGKIQYRYEGAPAMTAICHCRDCQKQTGTSFSIVQGVPLAALSVTGEMKIYTTTGVSGGSVRRHFCGDCGSPIYSAVDAMPGVVFLKAGTLDDVSALKPAVEMWCDTAQPWLALEPALPRFEQNPPMA